MKALRLMWYFRRRMVLCIIGTFISILFFGLLWLTAFPWYEGVNIVTMLPSKSEVAFQEGREDLAGLRHASVLTQTNTEFLLSRPICEKVIKEAMTRYKPVEREPSVMLWISQNVFTPALNLVMKTYYILNYGSYHRPTIEEKLVDDLMKAIEIEIVPGSYIIYITVTWDDPEIAQMLSNLLSEIFVEQNKKYNDEFSKKATMELESKISVSTKLLENMDQKIQQFKNEANINLGDRNVDMKMDELKRYRDEKNNIQIEIIDLQSKIKNFQSMRTEGDITSIQAKLASDKESITKIQAIIDELEKTLATLPGKELSVSDLSRERDQVEKQINLLSNRLNSLRATDVQAGFSIRPISPAIRAWYPKYPKLLINGVISILLGFMLGLFWVMGEEELIPRIYSVGDLPGIRVFPLIKYSRRKNSPYFKSLAWIYSRLTNKESRGITLWWWIEPIKKSPYFYMDFLKMLPGKTLVLDLTGGDWLKSKAKDAIKPTKISSLEEINIDFDGSLGFYVMQGEQLIDFNSKEKELIGELSVKGNCRVYIILPSPIKCPYTESLFSIAGEAISLVQAGNTTFSSHAQAYERLNNSEKLLTIITGTDFHWDKNFH